jgi:hypothetical protein
VFADRVAVRHAGDVVGDLAGLLQGVARRRLVIGRQQDRVRHEGFEQLAHDAAGFDAHAVHLVVAIQVRVQEAFQGGGFFAHLRREADQRRALAHVVDALRVRFLQQPA